VEACLAAAAARHGFAYALDCYQFLPATHLDHGHVLVRTLAESCAAVRGADARVAYAAILLARLGHPFAGELVLGATCEAPFFSVDRGIPTVVFGPGSLQQAHTADEYVEVRQVLDGARVYVDLVRRLLASG